MVHSIKQVDLGKIVTVTPRRLVKVNGERILELQVPLLARLVDEPQVRRLVPLDREERVRTQDLHSLAFLSVRDKIEVKKASSCVIGKIFI